MLPIKLMKPLLDKMKKEPKIWMPTYREALQCQTAVAIEIETRCVLRIDNLANLEVGRHLMVTKNGVMRISIPAHEVKNSVEINRVLPTEAAELITLYIERFRPVLLRAPSDHLFPGTKGRAKQVGHLSQQISDCIRREIGVDMHVHLFRHFAAKTYLTDHPGAYGVIRLTHGHKSVNTTTAFYADGSEGDAAHKHYDAHLDRLRQNSRDDVLRNKLERA
jgi:Phage integrase family